GHEYRREIHHERHAVVAAVDYPSQHGWNDDRQRRANHLFDERRWGHYPAPDKVEADHRTPPIAGRIEATSFEVNDFRRIRPRIGNCSVRGIVADRTSFAGDRA